MSYQIGNIANIRTFTPLIFCLSLFSLQGSQLIILVEVFNHTKVKCTAKKYLLCDWWNMIMMCIIFEGSQNIALISPNNYTFVQYMSPSGMWGILSWLWQYFSVSSAFCPLILQVLNYSQRTYKSIYFSLLFEKLLGNIT